MRRKPAAADKSRIIRATACITMLVAVLCGGCGRETPPILPESAKYMPPDLQMLYLGMEKAEVDEHFTAHGTQLTNRGLETVTQYVRDSVNIGVAFAYRDGRLVTATIWYDYNMVPDRIDDERLEFLKHLIANNGPQFDFCSFTMEQGKYVPDVGLIWKHPACMATTTFAKPNYSFPDTVSFRPYYQFSIFSAPITPWHLWQNIIIPAEESERPFLREADSLRSVIHSPATD